MQNKVTQQLALGAFIRNSSLLEIATKSVKFCKIMESLQTVRIASQGEAVVRISTQTYTGKMGKRALPEHKAHALRLTVETVNS